MNEEMLKAVVKYSKLPITYEKADIDRQYLQNEISNFDFYCKAKDYLDKQSEMIE